MYCSHQYLSIDTKKVCHAHLNAHKPRKPVTLTICMTEMYCSQQYLSIDLKKKCHAHFNAHKPQKPVTPTHAHFNAHKPRKPVTPKIVMLDKKF